MQSIETEAKTVQEAIIIACDQLKTTEENLNIEIIENPSSKLFSIFSSKKAKDQSNTVKYKYQIKLERLFGKIKGYS